MSENKIFNGYHCIKYGLWCDEVEYEVKKDIWKYGKLCNGECLKCEYERNLDDGGNKNRGGNVKWI